MPDNPSSASPLRKARNTGQVGRKRATSTYGPAKMPPDQARQVPLAPVPPPGDSALNGDMPPDEPPTWGTTAPRRFYTPMPPPRVPSFPTLPAPANGNPPGNGLAQAGGLALRPGPASQPNGRRDNTSRPIIRSGHVTGRPALQPGVPLSNGGAAPHPELYGSSQNGSVPLWQGYGEPGAPSSPSAALSEVPLGASARATFGPAIRPGHQYGTPTLSSARAASTPALPRWAEGNPLLNIPTGAALVQPDVRLARIALRRYLRSIWPLAELALIGLMFAVAFHSTFDTTYFFATANLGLGLLSVLTTYLLTNRVLPPRVYVRRALRARQQPRVGGLLLASSALRVADLAVLLGLALGFQRMPDLTVGALAIGALGLLANTILIAAVTVVLASPIATQLKRVAFLTWLVAALYSYTYGDGLAKALAFTRLPLLPYATTYNVSTSGQLGSDGVLGLLVELGCILALAYLANNWLAGRLRQKLIARVQATM